MGNRHIEALVVGPSGAGELRVRLGNRETNVLAAVIPPDLRAPNSKFVAIVRGGDVVGVEREVEGWLRIHSLIRSILNSQWDPIGVAGEVPDEYDAYILPLYDLIVANTGISEIVDYLHWVETERMGLPSTSTEGLKDNAERLLLLLVRFPVIGDRRT